jgi:hypothetical protein
MMEVGQWRIYPEDKYTREFNYKILKIQDRQVTTVTEKGQRIHTTVKAISGHKIHPILNTPLGKTLRGEDG